MLTLSTFCHLAAVLLDIFGQMVGADAALQVARQRKVDELGVRQIEIRHDGAELFKRALLPQPRIAFDLLVDRGYAPLLVIMGRIDQRVARKREKLACNACIQRFCIALLEVGAPAAFNKQRVAAEKPVTVLVRKVPGSVSRRMNWLQLEAADLEWHAVLNADVSAGQAVEGRGGNLAAGLFLQCFLLLTISTA